MKSVFIQIRTLLDNIDNSIGVLCMMKEEVNLIDQTILDVKQLINQLSLFNLTSLILIDRKSNRTIAILLKNWIKSKIFKLVFRTIFKLNESKNRIDSIFVYFFILYNNFLIII